MSAYPPTIPSQHSPAAPLSVGQWMLTRFLLAIPTVGFVMLFVWAFSDGVDPNKRNYCRATLIFYALIIGLVILMVVVFGGIGAISAFLDSHRPAQITR